jgi:uncharacterized membrane protein YcaP (DUF421 family)
MDFNILFGSGGDLSPLQMGFRGFVMFFITLILIRIGGMRIFGKKSAFDNIIIIMLGAVLARGVVGASPFFSTVFAAAVMVIVHRVLAILAMRYIWVGKIVKGIHRTLYENGEMKDKRMKLVSISEDDLLEAVRLQINKNSLDVVDKITIEKSGELSVIEKEGVR